MNRCSILPVGLVGTVIAAVCCFTPALVILLGAVGLSTLLVWSDYVLVPALVLFVGVTVYGLRLRRHDTRKAAVAPTETRADARSQ